jgi:putative sterol carrier protein
VVDIQPALQKLIDRFQEAAVQKSLSGFTKSLVFRFPDLNEEWVLHTVDGREASLSREACPSPDVTTTMTSEVFAGIMDKKINPMAAYLQRKIRIKGPMEDILKMQKLML